MTGSILLVADSPFLSELLDALRRRSKALRHRNAALDTQRVVEVREGHVFERIEIICRRRPYQRLGVTVRDDRWVWVNASESIKNAGWKFQWAFDGRLIGSCAGHELVEAIEMSLSAMFEMTNQNTDRLDGIWTRLLAQGPKLV